MNRIPQWMHLGAGAFLVTAVLTFGGCATEGPVRPAGLGEKIEAARTRADHQAIAAVYERQAQDDKRASEQHSGLARIYSRRQYSSGGVAGPNPAMVAHCQNLARIYQQAVEENLALAKMHRQMAAEAKD
jgi:hypothetical protein